jgi:hypothetical protein
MLMSKGTKIRNVRVPDDEWLPALEVARDRGETLASVLRAALARYVSLHRPS